MRNKPNSLNNLQSAGFAYEDACALRRIAMTLHRWHELECGSDAGAIERGHEENGRFTSDENGKPFWRLTSRHGVVHIATPDRERGALKRLAAIMARYPGFVPYVQGDPRGASLYIVARDRIPAGASLDTCYSNGIAVFK